ncbi:odorant receptor 46a-like [Aricia agestis]|uniref:odorant receptor 46a-like n=1 Tax=Aricia agestis TaxID=91739 RepID=UPI001C203ABF|nr:odorant receptor 46a-like [Aricia agestis]
MAKQIDCFSRNMKFWVFLGVSPNKNLHRYYYHYSVAFILAFVIMYDFLAVINFYFIPRNIDQFIGDMLFTFTEFSVMSKVLTLFFLKDKIVETFETLEGDVFQPDTEKGQRIVEAAKKFNIRYWKIVAIVSFTSNLTHMSSPMLAHIFASAKLEFPVSSYSFLSENLFATFQYPIYIYQCLGIHFQVLYNLNIDTFFLGLMIFVIAQLEILEEKLTDTAVAIGSTTDKNTRNEVEQKSIANLNKAIDHYQAVSEFCALIQDIFGKSLFVQLTMASCIICVCLFRFTMPAPANYLVFLATYLFIMIIQIMIPCWFGTCIMEKSCLLSRAIYNCNWTDRRRPFKSSLRLFVERANRPLSITGWKMFPLSLNTFTSIMNSAYSFFTLLRNVQNQ